VLALSLRRDFWDSVLSQAVMSNIEAHLSTQRPGGLQSRWKAALRASNVVMQWDPDHQPFTGHKTNHRVIQLGLRGDVLAAFRGPAFGGDGGIQDVTAFAKATKDMHHDRHVVERGLRSAASLVPMMLPAEEPYPVEDTLVAQRLGID
ncbi:unnamed protein product, partial [Hapterophycus canaliculatus]